MQRPNHCILIWYRYAFRLLRDLLPLSSPSLSAVTTNSALPSDKKSRRSSAFSTQHV